MRVWELEEVSCDRPLMICFTDMEVHDSGKRVMFEDFQGVALDALLSCDVEFIDIDYMNIGLSCHRTYVHNFTPILVIGVDKDTYDAIHLSMINSKAEPDFNSAYPKDLTGGDITTEE